VPSGLDNPDLRSDFLPLAVLQIGTLVVARRAKYLTRAVVCSPLGGMTLDALLEVPCWRPMNTHDALRFRRHPSPRAAQGETVPGKAS